jgi:hypothetical protein
MLIVSQCEVVSQLSVFTFYMLLHDIAFTTYTKHIKGLFQSRPSAAAYVLSLLAHATTAV